MTKLLKYDDIMPAIKQAEIFKSKELKWLDEIIDSIPPAQDQSERIEALEDCLHKIQNWCKAYPLTIFTEPDWKEVKEKLGDTLLTQVSGSNMRHVVTGIQAIIDECKLKEST